MFIDTQRIMCNTVLKVVKIPKAKITQNISRYILDFINNADSQKKF